MKQKLRKLIIVLVLVFISVLGIDLINNNVQAFEIFNEDYVNWGNWFGIPVNVYGKDTSLWCMGHKNPLGRYITAPKALNTAYYANERSNEFYGIKFTTDGYGNKKVEEGYKNTKFYKYYSKSATEGFLSSHSTVYNRVKESFEQENIGKTLEEYKGSDMAKTVGVIRNQNWGLPLNNSSYGLAISYPSGAVDNVLYSITYSDTGEEISNNEVAQGALYALSSFQIYGDGVYRWGAGESLSEDQKTKGMFTAYETQWALWELPINEGQMEYTNQDRNLGNIATGYQAFYNQIHINGYSNVVNVKAGDSSIKIEETTTDINGQEYTTYVFDKKIENKDDNKCVLGPYQINYVTNSENNDVYYTEDGYEIKFNAIEDITVYNKDKKDIKSLGGSFRIAYSADGQGVTKKRINDKTEYYVKADGKEVPAFDSSKPFYVIVDKGSMKDDDFTGFYTKIDFQYLDHIDGTLKKHTGTINTFYYNQTTKDYIDYNIINAKTAKPTGETKQVKSKQGDFEDTTQYSYELKKGTSSGTKVQPLVEANSANITRVYKVYSIVLTSEKVKTKPNLELYKACPTENKALQGAKFKVTLSITGELDGVDIDETVEFDDMITDKDGLIKITSDDIKKKNDNLNMELFTGNIIAGFEEIEAPQNHEISQKSSSMTITCEEGLITRLLGNNTKLENNTAKITVYNNHKTGPGLEIIKLERGSNRPLAGAKLAISFYTVNVNAWTIGGQTRYLVSSYKIEDLEFTKTTQADGLVKITMKEIQDKLNDLNYYGQNIINNTNSNSEFDLLIGIKELEAPSGYNKIDKTGIALIHFSNSGVESASEFGVFRVLGGQTTVYFDGINFTNGYYGCPCDQNYEARVIVYNQAAMKPEIVIHKLDASNNSPLAGATLDVTLTDSKGVSYLLGQYITGEDGLATITADDIKSKGLDLTGYTGTLTMSVVETKAPEGFDKSQANVTVKFQLKKGLFEQSESSGVTYTTDETRQVVTANVNVYNFPETPNTPKLPRIQFKKLDQSGNKLGGAILSISVNDKYNTGRFRTTNGNEPDYTIYFSNLFINLLSYNPTTRMVGYNPSTSLINELDDVSLNNSSKFFKPEFECGEDGNGLKVGDVRTYVTSVVKSRMLSAVHGTDTWKEWAEIKRENDPGHSAYIKAKNARDALSEPKQSDYKMWDRNL